MLVVVSSPPGCWPVSTSGWRLARAVYSAAVQPAQPEPMTMTFSISARKVVAERAGCKFTRNKSRGLTNLA